ncbi:hypothetical protein PRIPAC_72293, partial [Pristionchus pacificus]
SEEVDAEVVRVLGRIQEDRRKAKERSEKRKKERAAKEERPATSLKEDERKEEDEEAHATGDAIADAADVDPMELDDVPVEKLAPADDPMRPDEDEEAAIEGEEK